MSKKLQNIAAISTIFLAVIAISGYFLPKSTSIEDNQVESGVQYSSATLLILGSQAEITIKKGSPNIPLAGGTLSSSGAKQTLYLPVGQRLEISIFGSGASIGIEKSIAQYINVTSNASGTNVYEL